MYSKHMYICTCILYIYGKNRAWQLLIGRWPINYPSTNQLIVIGEAANQLIVIGKVSNQLIVIGEVTNQLTAINCN